MDDKKSGGPAFPNLISYLPGQPQRGDKGMDLRDYFAAAAMQGICANPDISAAGANDKISPANMRESVAKSSYQLADAMIAAREA